MRRLIILLCTVLVLTGCSGMPSRNNITNLLSAPKFSQTESNIVEAIADHIGENITLRYSQSQGYSSPVQLIDIDGDENDEAIVFYYAPNKGTNIRMAVLSYSGERWNIVSDKEGLGTEVFYFDTAEFKQLENRQLLVGYLSSNIDENFFVTYFTDSEKNIPDYVERCQDIVVGDVNYDGYSDIILTNRTADGRIRLRSLAFEDSGTYKVVGTRLLRYYNIDITQLKAAQSVKGETVLYADYRDDYNQMHTEAVVFRDGGKMYDAFASTVVSKQWEYNTDLNCVDIDGDGYLETPSVIHTEHTEDPEILKTVEWTDYIPEQPQRKCIGIYDTHNDMFVAYPDSWQDNVTTSYGSDSWQIVRRQTEENLQQDSEQNPQQENVLVTVSQVDYRNDIETGAYSYIVYKSTKTWHFDFDRSVDLSEIQYILKNIPDLG